MIEQKVLPAKQAVPGAPWGEISLDALNLRAVQQTIDNARRRKRRQQLRRRGAILCFQGVDTGNP
jgi:hypothetical protein